MQYSINASNSIVNIRVIATMIIVFYHCTCPLYIWPNVIDSGGGDNLVLIKLLSFITLEVACNTMLPTFFLLSGMVYFGRIDLYKDRKKTFWKKFDRLFIPFTIITSVCLRLKQYIGLPDLAVGHLWFIEVLGICFMVVLFFHEIRPIVFFIVSIILHGLYIILPKYQVHLPWVLGHLFNFFIYFILGYYANIYYECLREKKIVKWIVLLISILLLITHQQTLYSFAFNAFLLCFVPNNASANRLWISINKHSFAIYLLHHPIVVALLFTPCFQYLYTQYVFMAILLMFILAFSLSWLLSEGLQRVGFKYF